MTTTTHPALTAATPLGTRVVRNSDGCTGTLVHLDEDGAQVVMDATPTHPAAGVLGSLRAFRVQAAPAVPTHGTACRAHAIGCAVENVRDAKADPIVAVWAATADPVDEGDRYLSEGLASCLCGTDATWAASWVLLGLAAMDEAAAKLVAADEAKAAAMAEARTMARVMGSVGATVRYEHVAADGSVVVDAEATYTKADEAPTAYVVTNEARGIPRYVTTDKAAAVAWAQNRANEDAADRPGYATPHYVVTPWEGDESWTGAVHVYAKAAAK